MKKLLSLLLALVLLFTLACCGKKPYPYTCGENYVTEGLYNYYRDKVVSSPEDYSASADDEASISAAVKNCCSEYLAAISLMEKEGLTLENELKRLAAESTENIWSLFSSYYEEIGVTKQDITKVQSHRSRLLQLLDFYYGAKGKSPVKEIDLKEHFVDIYVGFKAIERPLTKTNDKGETVPLTEKEIKETEKLFGEMADSLNGGTATIDELNKEYNDSLGIIVTAPLSVVLTKKGDPMYSNDFFSSVKEMSYGKAKVIRSENSLYLIERQTIATDDEDAFLSYRSEVLEDMKMEKVYQKLEKHKETLVISENP